MIEVTVAGQSYKLEAKPQTGLEALKSLPRLEKGVKVIGVKTTLPDGSEQVSDLHMAFPTTGKVDFVTVDSAEGVDILRHSTAHILAEAVKALYPKVEVTIGPVIETGFFYDFAKRDGAFKDEDLAAIEKKMNQIISASKPVRREEWPVEKAIEYFKGIGEQYKCEIIQDLARDQGAKTVSVYWHGNDFVDLCRGPHVLKTSDIPAFKLTHVAGAYWRGSEKNEMLSRIYGTAFATKEAQAAYFAQLEEAKKRDHRRIGTDMGLFSFHPEAPASPFFHPAGAFVYGALQEFLRDLNRQYGFEDVISPLILSQDLWKMSGHYDNYRENMYFTQVDERDFAVKPMNCPGHCLIYKTGKLSYRDLPKRLAEFGRVHRHERSGVTAGLFRVRSFVQDDAHIYCTEDQIESEILRVLEMVRFFYGTLGFSFHVELSTRPEKRQGAEATWDKAEKALETALTKAGLAFKVNPGDGAFYGPKIDFHLKDSLGRTHQCGTVQLDFSMPGRFGLEYTGSDNSVHTPVMLHRAIAGSLERFFGIFIEHTAGHFPLWMAPRQAAVLSVSDDAKAFAEEVFKTLKAKGYRVELDDSNDKLAGKIKHCQLVKIPNMIVIGGREAAERVVTLRATNGSQKQGLTIEALLQEFQAQARPALPEPQAVSA
jgi:threonyl-tRNA synthetase